MAILSKICLLAGVAGVSGFVSAPIDGRAGQQPLGFGDGVSTSKVTCDLPPVLDPSGDGLPSADDLFSSDEALAKQVERHQAIVRVPSICFDDLGDFDKDDRWKPFYDLHDVLADTYPNVYKRATLDKINTFGLLYTVKGSDSSLKPTMLMAHQDVVPVADESTWSHPPFDALYDGEWLWGRGSSDDKNSMTALMSALETLLADSDWTPTRTILVAFGFDEECSGYRGAGSIGEYLTEEYGDDSVAIILDEGGLGLLPVGDVLYALPAVMEKGHVDVWFELRVAGGHSSIPFPHTGIGIMAEMVAALEAHPYEPLLTKDSPVYGHLSCQARYSPDAMPEVTEMIEKDDLEGIADYLVEMSRPTKFMVQTSQAIDYIGGGVKINAMPEVVSLGVNYRVAPQDSIPKVQHNIVKYISDIVAKYNISVNAFEGDKEYEDYLAEVAPEDLVSTLPDADYHGSLVLKADQKSEVAPASPTKGSVWDVFSGTIQHSFAFKDGTVVPTGETMTGNTDTRHYLNLSPNVYRWTPNRQGASENAHTVDERVRMEFHMDMVKFYYDFIRNFDAAEF